MTKTEISRTLKVIAKYEGAINRASGEELEIKNTCKILQGLLDSWGVVMNEFSDVISTLSSSESDTDRAWKAAFTKALQIVMSANRYKGEIRG